jgi:prepilin-type N-terminal cleavage/methylation domain-containing protein
MTRSRPIRRGFTLLELLLILAILVVIGAAAYPTLSSMYGDVKVKAAADQVRAAWVEARAEAIEDGREYAFGVEKDTGKFRVAPAISFVDVADLGEDSAPPYVQEGELTSGITFDLGEAENLKVEGAWTIVAVFKPDGTCATDVEIALKEQDAETAQLVVRVRAMTGAVKVAPKTPEGG